MRSKSKQGDRFGAKLKELREYKRLRQDYVAAKMQVSRSFLSKIENGKAILTLACFLKYCTVIDMDASTIIGMLN